jgi:hypothetical protein
MGILDDAIREHLELKRSHGAPEEEVMRQEAEALGPARREPPPAPGFDDAGAEPLAAPPGADAGVPFDDEAPPPPALDEIAPEPSLSDAPPPVVDQPTEAMPASELPEPPAAIEEEEDELAFPEVETEPPPAIAADEVPLHDQLAPEPEPSSAFDADLDNEDTAEHEVVDNAATRMRPLPPLDDDDLPPPPARPLSREPDPEPDFGPDEPELREPSSPAPPPLEERPVEAAPPPSEDDDDPLAETPDFLQETPEHDRLWFEQKPPRDFDFDD